MKNKASHLFSNANIVTLFLLWGVGLIAQEVFAQQRFFTNQQHFGVEEGLPQSYISGIVQDEDGFLWLSTLDGFCRYDGRGFKTFHDNAKDSSGLAANTLNGLGKLVNNTVTIYYSPTQADEFNLRTYKVTRNTVRNRLARIPGIRWQSYRFSYNSNNWFFTVNNNKGIGWLNAVTGKIHYASTSNGKLHSDTVSAITQSLDGRIYVVGENGVQVSDTSQTKFEWYAFETHVKQPSKKVGWDVFGDKFSIVALLDKRVVMLDKNTITLLDINKKSTSIVTVPDPPANAIRGDNGLQVDPNGRVYFEHYGRVYRLGDGGTLELLWENSGTPTRISSFFIDRSDVLWVSPNAQGLLRIDLRAFHFESYRYRGNFISEMMALRGNNGISLPKKWENPDAGYYFRQAQDSKGNLYSCNNWYGQSGIFRLTPDGFRPFAYLPEQKTFTAVVNMPGDEIWAFDQSEAVWYAQYSEAGWWGDEMLRIANVNETHFSNVAIAWYIGMHRSALLYVKMAIEQSNPAYWKAALHCEASALHSLTDLFSLGHAVVNRDECSFNAIKKKGLQDDPTYKGMERIINAGGGKRLDNGILSLSAQLPFLQNEPSSRYDFLPSYLATWASWGKTEHDYHDYFNKTGGTVRNFNGDTLQVYGDFKLHDLDGKSRRVIEDAVTASVQSLFDYFDMIKKDGKSSEGLDKNTGRIFAALKYAPVFVEKDPDNYFHGMWIPYANTVKSLLQMGSMNPGWENCRIPFLSGKDNYWPSKQSNPCTAF